MRHVSAMLASPTVMSLAFWRVSDGAERAKRAVRGDRQILSSWSSWFVSFLKMCWAAGVVDWSSIMAWLIAWI